MKTLELTGVTATFASATLTSNGTNVSAGDTVTVDGRVYTFRTALSNAEDEVLIGSTAEESLRNLARALNGAPVGTGEHTATTGHSTVRVTSYPTGLSLTVTAREAGTTGNAIAVSTTAPTLSWSSGTLSGGTDSVSVTAQLTETTWVTPAQQVSVLQRPVAAFPRTLMLTSDGVYLVRWEPGVALRVGIDDESLGRVAASCNRGLTPSPRITTNPSNITLVAGGAAGQLSGAATAELALTYQWELEHKARAVLTWDGVSGPNAGDTVTIDGKTYTFKTSLTPTEGEVLLAGGGTAALLNLARAINRTGTPGVDYYVAAAHSTVRASAAVTANAITVAALAAGAAGNGLAVSEAATGLAWDSATLTGGGSWVPVSGTLYDLTHTNPTSATLTVQASGPLGTGMRYRLVAMNAAGWGVSGVAIVTVTV